MTISWAVQDGYGGSRPQNTEVGDDLIADCDTVDEAMKLISDAIEEDFRQLSWHWDGYFEQVKEEAQRIIDEAKEAAE